MKTDIQPATLARKMRGVSDQKTGARLTANPAAAIVIRDPRNGKAHWRGSEFFKRMGETFAR